MRSPTETEFHKGLDGAILGLTAVFIAKLPVLAFFNYQFSWVRLSNRIQFGLTDWKGTISFLDTIGFASTSDSPSILLTFIPYLVARVANAPFHLFGHPEFILDTVLVWVGGWAAIPFPLWFWVITPFAFWINEFHPFTRILGVILDWSFSAVNRFT